jgi:hypothetical protein
MSGFVAYLASFIQSSASNSQAFFVKRAAGRFRLSETFFDFSEESI